MYRSFYGLKRKPFQISTNPSFLWLGEMHKEALAHLKYGIIESQGVLLLTGDVGTGKTTLINALIDSLGDEFIVARVPDPGMETIDFMNYIAHLFDMNKKFVSKDGFLIHFSHFLNSAYAAGKKVVLIIDESQRLSSDLLEEIRQLTNIENHGFKLLNIFLIGQIEFNDVLQETKNRALHQRISLSYVIKPLDIDETGEYIRHRLKMAGTEKELFNPDAIRSVYESSGGFPRRINIICDHALLFGFLKETTIVTGAMVRECVKDLLLPELSDKTNTEPIETGDVASLQNLKTIPAEGSQEKGSSYVKRTIGIVILSAMVVFIVTYIIYPAEYQNIFRYFSGFSEPHTQKKSVKSFDTKPEIKISDEGSIDLPVAKGLPVKNMKPASVVLKEDSMDVVQEKTTASVQTEDLPDVQPIKEGLDGEVDSARTKVSGILPPDSYTETASNKNLNTKAEMKLSDEDSIDLPAVKEPSVENIQPASVVLKDASIENFSDKPATFVQAEDLPASDPIEESNDEEVNLASTPLGGTSPSDQQDVAGDGVSLKTPVFSETAVKPKLETGLDRNEIEIKEKNVILENSALIVDTPVTEQKTEKEKTDVTDAFETSASDENESENEEFTSTKTDSKVDSELEEDLTQNKRNNLPDEPVEPVESVEAEEVANEDPEDMDPTALIDWLIKKRSK